MSVQIVPLVSSRDKIKNYSISDKVIRKKIVLDKNFRIKPVYTTSRISFPSVKQQSKGFVKPNNTRTTDQLFDEGDYMLKKVLADTYENLHIYQLLDGRLVEIPKRFIDGLIKKINAVDVKVFEFLNNRKSIRLPCDMNLDTHDTQLGFIRRSKAREFLNGLIPEGDETELVNKLVAMSVSVDEVIVPCTWAWPRSFNDFLQNSYVDLHLPKSKEWFDRAKEQFIVIYDDNTYDVLDVRPTDLTQVYRIMHVYTGFNPDWSGGGLMWYLFESCAE